MLCISRHTYDVNIILHLLLLNTFRVYSFITLSVVIKKNELNWHGVCPSHRRLISLCFLRNLFPRVALMCLRLLVVNNRLTSRNVGNINNLQKQPSVTLSGSSVCLSCDICCDYTCLCSGSFATGCNTPTSDLTGPQLLL